MRDPLLTTSIVIGDVGNYIKHNPATGDMLFKDKVASREYSLDELIHLSGITIASSGGSILVTQNESAFNLEVASVPPQNLGDLADVDVTGVVNGQVIKYLNGTWVASPDISGSLAVWGNIVGTIANQSDLQVALNGLTPLSTTASISGSLQTQIDSINVVAGSNISILESPANTFTVSTASAPTSATFLADYDARYVNVTGDTMSGQLVGITGSANIPSFSFTGDTDTGVFSPAANTFSVATSGGERVRVFNDGGVQIGGTYGTSPGVNNLKVGGTVVSTLNGSFNGVTVGLPTSANTNSTVVGNGAGGFSQDVSIGRSALAAASSNSNRTAVGYQALQAITSGSRNTGVGAGVLQTVTTGDNNTAVGAFAGNISTGSGGVFLGTYAGVRQTTASNLFIVNNVAQTSAATEAVYSLLYGTFSGVVSSLSGQSLTVNGTFKVNNSGIAAQAVPTGTIAQMTGASASVVRELLDSFGTGVYSAFSGRRARGTVDVPTAIQLNDEITHLSAWGYGATGYSVAARGFMSIFAAENWTDAAQGTRVSWQTTAPGGIVTSEKMRLWGDGGLQIDGTYTTSPGAGSLSLSNLIVQGNSTRKVTSANAVVATTDYDPISHGTSRGTVKYLIHLDDGTSVRSSEIIASFNGASVNYNEFAINDLGTPITGATWSVTSTGGNIILRLTRTSGTYSVRISRELIV